MRVPEGVGQLERDLRKIFGDRLQSLVVYAGSATSRDAPTQTMAVVDDLTPNDLRACAALVAAWHETNLGTPLLVPAPELPRSLDAFPLEFTAILVRYHVVAGRDPFEGLAVNPAHLRVACETQARSHLLHLREDYLETEGRSSALAGLITDSAPALGALVMSVAALEGAQPATPDDAARHVERRLGLVEGTLAGIVALSGGRPIGVEQARNRWEAYLDGVERLARHVDGWRTH